MAHSEWMAAVLMSRLAAGAYDGLLAPLPGWRAIYDSLLGGATKHNSQWKSSTASFHFSLSRNLFPVHSLRVTNSSCCWNNDEAN